MLQIFPINSLMQSYLTFVWYGAFKSVSSATVNQVDWRVDFHISENITADLQQQMFIIWITDHIF